MYGGYWDRTKDLAKRVLWNSAGLVLATTLAGSSIGTVYRTFSDWQAYKLNEWNQLPGTAFRNFGRSLGWMIKAWRDSAGYIYEGLRSDPKESPPAEENSPKKEKIKTSASESSFPSSAEREPVFRLTHVFQMDRKERPFDFPSRLGTRADSSPGKTPYSIDII